MDTSYSFFSAIKSLQLIYILGSLAIGCTVVLFIAIVLSAILRNQSASVRFQCWHFSFLSVGALPFLFYILPPKPIPWKFSSIDPPTANDISVRNNDHKSLVSPRTTGLFAAAGSPHSRKATSSTLQPKTLSQPGSDLNEKRNKPKKKIANSDRIKPRIRLVESSEFPFGLPTVRTTILFLAWIVPALWLLGVLFGLTRLTLACIKLSHFVSHGKPIGGSDSRFHLLNGKTLQELNHSKVSVLVSEDISTPIATGTWSPTILFPIRAKNWPVDRIEMVLAHEMEHIRRNDLLWQKVYLLVKAIFWFHPLVWYAWKNLQLERELACDDQVITSAAKPADYAGQLLEISRESSRYGHCPLGAISMSQKPIEKRIFSILDPNKDRRKATWVSCLFLAMLFFFLAVPVLTIRPLEAGIQKANLKRQEKVATKKSLQKPQKDPSPTNSTQKLPESFSGKVVNHLGVPVSNVQIKLEISFSDANGKFSRERKKSFFDTTTNENGEYSIATGQLNVTGPKVWTHCKVNSPDYPSKWFGWTYSKIPGKFRSTTTKFFKPRVIVGRVAGNYQKNGKTIRPNRPWITVASSNDVDLNNSWGSDAIRCKEDGSFRFVAPYNLYGEMIIRDMNFASKRISLKTGVPFGKKIVNLGEIELIKGTNISGTFVDEDNKPIAGAVAKIEKFEKSELQNIYLGDDWHCLTDDEGRFSFPQFSGNCTVSVCQSGKNPGEESISSELSYNPIVKPIKLNIVDGKSELKLTLKTAPTVVLSGVARWQDGTPVADVEFLGSTMDGSAAQLTKTDMQGRYSLRFRKTAKTKYVSCTGIYDKDRRLCFAVLRSTFPAPAGHVSGVHFRKITEDRDGIDWVMRPCYEGKLGLNTSPSMEEYRKLCAGYNVDKSFFQKRMKTLDLEKRPQFAIKNNPFTNHITSLLNHEKKHRGKHSGFAALGEAFLECHKQGNASTIAFLDIIETRILDHYKDDEKLLPFLNKLVPFWDLLKRGRSPFLYRIKMATKNLEIRAEANYQLLQLYVASDPNVNRGDLLPGINVRNIEATIHSYAKDIKSTYGKEIRRVHGIENNFNFGISFAQRSAWEGKISFNPNPKTYGELVDSALRDVFEIRPGKQFPKVQGIGFDGKTHSLSQQKGKLVILISGDTGYSYSDRELAKKLRQHYGPDKLEVLLVSNSGEYNSFYRTEEEIETGKIEGVIINDSPTREIGYFLNSCGYQDHYYLIDTDGKLLCRAPKMAPLESKIKETLQ